MTLDDYKELMRFHILLSDIDLSGQHYAAVDTDGELNVYAVEPRVIKTLYGIDNYFWGIIVTPTSFKHFVCVLEMPDDAKETLIEL